MQLLRPTHPYVWTAEGWLYVATVVDLFSRRVVGWSMKAEMNVYNSSRMQRRSFRTRCGKRPAPELAGGACRPIAERRCSDPGCAGANRAGGSSLVRRHSGSFTGTTALDDLYLLARFKLS